MLLLSQQCVAARGVSGGVGQMVPADWGRCWDTEWESVKKDPAAAVECGEGGRGSGSGSGPVAGRSAMGVRGDTGPGGMGLCRERDVLEGDRLWAAMGFRRPSV